MMMSCKLVLLLATLALVGCTDPEGAIKTASSLGLTNVRAGGYSMFACGQGDVFATSFTALSPQGRPVSGVVCKGFMKGSTVRLD